MFAIIGKVYQLCLFCQRSQGIEDDGYVDGFLQECAGDGRNVSECGTHHADKREADAPVDALPRYPYSAVRECKNGIELFESAAEDGDVCGLNGCTVFRPGKDDAHIRFCQCMSIIEPVAYHQYRPAFLLLGFDTPVFIFRRLLRTDFHISIAK